jgi:hypothetical protein
MNMKIPCVEVDIGDLGVFQKVCLLVDRPDFINDAQKVRVSWWLEKIKPTNWRTWNIFLLELDRKKQGQLNSVIAKGVAEAYRMLTAESDRSMPREDLKRYGREFMEHVRQLIPSCFFRFMFEIYGLQHKYKTPPQLLPAIEAAVVCWRITAKDIESDCHGSIFETEKLIPVMLRENERAIITDKKLSKNRVKQFTQQMLIGNRHQSRRSGSTIYDIDLRHYSIKNMREYYWQHVRGVTTKDIANTHDAFEDTVKQNFKRYRQLLNRKLQ